MKKVLISILVLTFLLLTACQPVGGNSSDTSTQTGEDTLRYFNQTNITPDDWCVADGNYSNTYSGSPDILPAEDFRGNVASDLCFYDRTLIESHMLFSFEELE